MRKRFQKLERGQGMVEYSLIIFFIAISLIVVTDRLYETIQDAFLTVLCEMRNLGRNEVNCYFQDDGLVSEDVWLDPGLPVPYFSFEYCGTQGVDICFDAEGSSDNGSIVEAQWQFGDSTTYEWTAPLPVNTNAWVSLPDTDPPPAPPTGLNPPPHDYTAGDYFVTLTLTDDLGQRKTYGQLLTFSNTNKFPQASFFGLCGGSICAFDASNSTDTDGTIVSYVWTFTDKTTGATKSLAPQTSSLLTGYDFQYGGRYRVSLVVYDEEGANSTTVYKDYLIAGAANNEPHAAITLVSCTGTTCTFSGATSYDDEKVPPSNGIAGYAWDCNGDGAYNEGASITVSCNFETYGNKVVSLTVRDYAAVPATDTESLSVPLTEGNSAPIITDGSIAISACDINLLCTLTASAIDPNVGDSLTYQMDIEYNGTFAADRTGSVVSGNISTSFDFASTGTKNIALRVSDGSLEDIEYDTVDVTFNKPPVIQTFPNPDCTGDPTCNFNPTITDDESDPLTITYDYGDGNSGTSTTHCYSSNNTYTVTVSVTDPSHSTPVTSSKNVTISNATGVCGAGGSLAVNFTSLTNCANTTNYVCTFTNTTPTTPSLTSCTWSFGFSGTQGQSTSCGSSVATTYPAPGTYTVSLTASNSSSQSGAKSTTAYVVHGYSITDVGKSVIDVGNKWQAVVTFTVINKGNNQPLAGVTIKGDFSQGVNNVTCTTNASGICSVNSGDIADAKTSTDFTIDTGGVTGGGMPYYFTGNGNADSSNGTWSPLSGGTGTMTINQTGTQP